MMVPSLRWLVLAFILCFAFFGMAIFFEPYSTSLCSHESGLRVIPDAVFDNTHISRQNECVCDADCPDSLLCDQQANPTECRLYDKMHPPVSFRTASLSLQQCLSTRRLIVVGDETTKAVWGLLVALANGERLLTYNHGLTFTHRELVQGWTFDVLSFHFPLAHDSVLLSHRPFRSDLDAMNAIEEVWNEAGNASANVSDILFVGSASSSWAVSAIHWLKFRDNLQAKAESGEDPTRLDFRKYSTVEVPTTWPNDIEDVIAPMFEFTGIGTCGVDFITEPIDKFSVADLLDCQMRCIARAYECTGIAFSNITLPPSNCRVFLHSPGPVRPCLAETNIDAKPLAEMCFSYHPKTRLDVRALPPHVPIILRSNSPHGEKYQGYPASVEEEQRKIANLDRKYIRDATKEKTGDLRFVGSHPVRYFDMYHRLVEHMKQKRFRDNILFDSQHGSNLPSVTGTIASDILNDFVALFCEL
jgi:hypothetical protein